MPSSAQDGRTRTAVLNVVGLTNRLIGKRTPRIEAFRQRTENQLKLIEPVLPAVTCTAQSTYLTGKSPSEHGIVANGWYDRNLNEHHFWKQSNQLVGGEKIWDAVRRDQPDFTCAKLFWWFNMYSGADYSITPRPLYRSDGLKTFDIHTNPLSIRDEIKRDLGEFPFSSFWGPRAGIKSSEWIAESAKWIESRHSPDLSLVYLPHLDYDLQKLGPNHPSIDRELSAIDELTGNLIDFLENRGVQVTLLSEYGITEAKKVVYPNRLFRRKGWLNLKDELSLEYLDCGGSRAFAITDHQVAHIYLMDQSPSFEKEVRQLLEGTEGVAQVLDRESRKNAGLDHPRSGDLIAFADEDAWFAYYHWEEDAKAPDFARCVDVHRKYGYDPTELFVDPKIVFPSLKGAFRLLQKKLGFRTFFDLVPLDATLVKGTHGALPKSEDDWPIAIGKFDESDRKAIPANEVSRLLIELITSRSRKT